MHNVEFVITEGGISEDARGEVRKEWCLEMRVEGNHYPVAKAHAWTIDGASSELGYRLQQLLDHRMPA